MNKENLVRILQKVLNTDEGLTFLLKLQKTELETLVARIREQVENKQG